MASDCPKLDIATLVDEHCQAVYRYAYRLCGSRVDAEDLVQQTFLDAQQSLDQLRDPEKARPWLLAILRMRFLKSRRRVRPLDAGSLGIDLDQVADPAAAHAIDDSELLQTALNQLPPEFKIVLLMFYFEGLSYREIAEKLRLPAGTVMSRLSRAKGHLRAKLSARPSAPPAQPPVAAVARGSSCHGLTR